MGLYRFAVKLSWAYMLVCFLVLGLVDLGDGKFEILLVRAPKNIQEMHECIVALKNQTYDCGMLKLFSAPWIKISADADMPWTLDGEKADGRETIFIENLHHGISLIH